MKPHSPSSPPFSPPPALRRFLPRAVSFLLFSLGYTLGFLSSTSSSPPQPPQFHVQTQPQSQPHNEIPVPTSRPSVLSPHDLLRFRTKCTDPIPWPDVLRTILDHIYNGSSPFIDFPPPAIAPVEEDLNFATCPVAHHRHRPPSLSLSSHEPKDNPLGWHEEDEKKEK